MYLSTDDFLAGIVGGETDVELPGIGTVRVRSLTTLEAEQINAQAKGNNMQISLLAIQTALVKPQLSADNLSKLEQAKPGVVSLLTQRIMALSGMGDDFLTVAGAGS